MDIILRVIVSASKEPTVCEEVLLLCHIILTKVGPKGKIYGQFNLTSSRSRLLKDTQCYPIGPS